MIKLKPKDPPLPVYCAEHEYQHRLYVDFKRGFWELLTQDVLEDTVELYEHQGFARTWDLPPMLDGVAWRRVTAILNKLVARIPEHCHERRNGTACLATYDDIGLAAIDSIDDLLKSSWERLVGDWEIWQAADWCKCRHLGITSKSTTSEIEAVHSQIWEQAIDAHIVLEGLSAFLYRLRRQNSSSRA